MEHCLSLATGFFEVMVALQPACVNLLAGEFATYANGPSGESAQVFDRAERTRKPHLQKIARNAATDSPSEAAFEMPWTGVPLRILFISPARMPPGPISMKRSHPA